MEKLNLRLASCRQALMTLAEALQLPFSIIVRDVFTSNCRLIWL